MKKHIFFIFFLSFIINHSLFCQTWQTYDSLRTAYLQKRSYDTALIYSEKALQIVKEKVGENDTLYATMLTYVYEINYYKGNYTKAIEYCQKEKEITKTLRGEKHPAYLESLNSLALFYKTIGDFIAAEPLYIEALKINKEVSIDKPLTYAISLNGLAELYRIQGKYLFAEPLFLQAKNIYKEVLGEKNPNYIQSINSIALLYYNIGNYTAAETLFLEAKKICKEVLGEKHPNYAASLNNLSALYMTIGNYQAAEPLFIEAKNIYKEILGDKHPNYAGSIRNLALLYYKMDNYAAAEPLFLESMNIIKENFGDKNPNYANSLNSLATLYLAMGNYLTAESLFLESNKIIKEVMGGKHPDYENSLNNLATLYRSIGNNEKAESYYIENLNVCFANINQNFSFLSEKEKEVYFKTKTGTFEYFYSFSLKRKTENKEITKIVYNYVVKNKGLLLKSSTAMRIAILNSKDTSLIAKYNNWIALKKEISKLYSTEISKRKKNPEDLEQHANTIEKDMVRSSQIFSDFNKLQNLTWESVKKSLKPNEAAIEFLHFTEGKKNDTITYCALIVKSDSKYPEMVKLFEESQLSALLSKVSNNDNTNVNYIYGTNQNTNEQLYKLIWQPIEKYLEGVKTVYYSPDGLLHKVSFSAISNGKNSYLCDSYNLKQLSSTIKVAMPEKFTLTGEITAGLFGGIEYSTDTTSIKIWDSLPGTKNETDIINQIFIKNKVKTIYYTGATATEDIFKSTAANCNILHLSTHGFFFPDPEEGNKSITESEKNENDANRGFWGKVNGFGVWDFVKNKNPLMRSGLALAYSNNVWNQRFPGNGEDGVLTASEVALLDLQKTQLVVLSACETGLGDIKGSEGVYGLQRAFKMAGAKYLVMSLWQVPDEETKEFMTKFYGKLLTSKDIRKSFNETQSEMRKNYDPFFWAAFVLIE